MSGFMLEENTVKYITSLSGYDGMLVMMSSDLILLVVPVPSLVHAVVLETRTHLQLDGVVRLEQGRVEVRG